MATNNTQNNGTMKKKVQIYKNRCSTIPVARKGLYCSHPGPGRFYIIVSTVPEHGQYSSLCQACGHQCAAGHWNDLRHLDRRY